VALLMAIGRAMAKGDDATMDLDVFFADLVFA
jgi:hypothetical protein